MLEKIARKLFYTLGPKTRFWARRFIFLPKDLVANNNVLMPPKGMIYTGSGDFLKQGTAWKDFLVENGLQPHHDFLDIGSGNGRIAIGLKNYLKGSYQGFEAMEVGVNWCQKNISTRYPNFQFRFVPIYNDLYNSKGIDAATYEFEYSPKSFDVVVSISVFTHIIDVELENYIAQTVRVMKDDGILVATFFITENGENQSNEHENPHFRFPVEKENYFLMDAKVQSANVCYKRKYLENLLEKNGLEIVREIKGYWSGYPKQHYLGFQDVMVIRKKNPTKL